MKDIYDEMYYCYTYITAWYQVYSTGYTCRGFLAVALDADHPTRTLTRTVTRTLWGDLCLDAVACEGSRLIRPKGVLWMGGAYFKTRAPECAYNFFEVNLLRSRNPSRHTASWRARPTVVHHHRPSAPVPEFVSIAIPGTQYQT